MRLGRGPTSIEFREQIALGLQLGRAHGARLKMRLKFRARLRHELAVQVWTDSLASDCAIHGITP